MLSSVRQAKGTKPRTPAPSGTGAVRGNRLSFVAHSEGGCLASNKQHNVLRIRNQCSRDIVCLRLSPPSPPLPPPPFLFCYFGNCGAVCANKLSHSGRCCHRFDYVTEHNIPIHHSRPSSSKKMYLNFNGQEVHDTAWNSASTPVITSVPYVAL